MEDCSQHNHKSIKSSVFDRIECEKICPKARWRFLTHEYVLWLLWAVCVVVGALAVAVTLFVLTYRQYALYEATHDNWFTFIVGALPYLWIALIALMALVAVYNIRHTKCGYRYPLWQIFGSSMVLSLAGGAALQLFGFGYSVDQLLGQQIRQYISQEKMEERIWQAPEHGRLVGKLTHRTVAPTSTAIFTDMHGDVWRVNISELSPTEQSLLEQQTMVRLIGAVSNDAPHVFHSCGAFPWLFDTPMNHDEMRAARLSFMEKLDSYEERIRTDDSAMASSAQRVLPSSPCDHSAPVRRMIKYRNQFIDM